LFRRAVFNIEAFLKKIIRKFPFVASFLKNLNNQFSREAFIKGELEKIPRGKMLLDAGCGSQRYRKYCSHLLYRGQDFGKFKVDEKKMLGGGESSVVGDYEYGELDYTGNIWSIDEKDGHFDAILCTEVFEHIPYPIETLIEFSRLLKKDGRLILTAPSNCLRHMDPYFFYSGFSDRWFEKFLNSNGLKLESIYPVGDYYSWLAVEMARTAATHSIFAKFLLAPAFFYFYCKKQTSVSVSTLCMGYHVVAVKI
jgi:SAM-dependent methyltransferase